MKTKQLKELERLTPDGAFTHGYQKALEDLAPVLAASRKHADEHRKWPGMASDGGCQACQDIRDALAAVEV